MAAIHRVAEILTGRVKTIWDEIFRRARWIAASSYRVLLAVLVSLFIVLLIAFGKAVISYSQGEKLTGEDFQQAMAAALAALPDPTAIPVLDVSVTETPFAPIKSTPLVIPTALPPALEAEVAVVEKTEESPVEPSTDFYGINFSNNKERVSIKIIPKNKKINSGKPIVISFLPGKRCVFGDQHACVAAFLNENLGNTIFLTVHSGEGGQAQSYRNALEGTLINSGAYTPKKVQSNMSALDGAKVILSQGNKTVEGLELSFVSRIPPRSLRRYLSSSMFEALGLAVSIDGDLNYQTDPKQPQLVFETCGWRLPGEAMGPVSTATSAAIYLSVIQKVNGE
jgi:hypothetical protein